MSIIDDSISVVIPVYNGAKTLDKLIEELNNYLPKFREYEMIFIDDNSQDNSCEILIKYALNDDKITFISLAENVGQQRATLLGLTKASGRCSLIMDDDFSHRAGDILHLYNKLISGYDVVYGINKVHKGKAPLRMLGSNMRDRIFDILTDKDKELKVSSFRIIDRHIVDKIVMADKRFVYLSMEILKSTTNIANIYVDYRHGGPTNYSFKKLFSLFWGIYLYYSRLGIMKVFRRKFAGYKITKRIEKGREL